LHQESVPVMKVTARKRKSVVHLFVRTGVSTGFAFLQIFASAMTVTFSLKKVKVASLTRSCLGIIQIVIRTAEMEPASKEFVLVVNNISCIGMGTTTI